jgi:hypothetical protein
VLTLALSLISTLKAFAFIRNAHLAFRYCSKFLEEHLNGPVDERYNFHIIWEDYLRGLETILKIKQHFVFPLLDEVSDGEITKHGTHTLHMSEASSFDRVKSCLPKYDASEVHWNMFKGSWHVWHKKHCEHLIEEDRVIMSVCEKLASKREDMLAVFHDRVIIPPREKNLADWHFLVGFCVEYLSLTEAKEQCTPAMTTAFVRALKCASLASEWKECLPFLKKACVKDIWNEINEKFDLESCSADVLIPLETASGALEEPVIVPVMAHEMIETLPSGSSKDKGAVEWQPPLAIIVPSLPEEANSSPKNLSEHIITNDEVLLKCSSEVKESTGEESPQLNDKTIVDVMTLAYSKEAFTSPTSPSGFHEDKQLVAVCQELAGDCIKSECAQPNSAVDASAFEKRPLPVVPAQLEPSVVVVAVPEKPDGNLFFFLFLSFLIAPLAFAVVRNAHEAFRSCFKVMDKFLNGPEEGRHNFYVIWIDFLRSMNTHAEIEDRLLFPLLDEISDGEVKKSRVGNLHVTESESLSTAKSTLPKRDDASGSEWASFNIAYHMWHKKHAEHFLEEEKVMVPLFQKVAATPEERSIIFHDRIITPARKRNLNDWLFHIGFCVGYLSRYGGNRQSAAIATTVYVRGLKSASLPWEWAECVSVLKRASISEVWEDINTKFEIESSNDCMTPRESDTAEHLAALEAAMNAALAAAAAELAPSKDPVEKKDIPTTKAPKTKKKSFFAAAREFFTIRRTPAANKKTAKKKAASKKQSAKAAIVQNSKKVAVEKPDPPIEPKPVMVEKPVFFDFSRKANKSVKSMKPSVKSSKPSVKSSKPPVKTDVVKTDVDKPSVMMVSEVSEVGNRTTGLITEKPDVSEDMTSDDADNSKTIIDAENKVVKGENSSSAVSKKGSDEKSTKVMDRESTAACTEAPVEASGLITEKSVPCGETTSNPVKKANNSKKSVKKQPVKKKKSEASIMAWFQKVSGLGTKKAQPKTTGIKESKGKKINSSEAKESTPSGTEHSESSDAVNSYTSIADVYSAKNTSSEVEMLNSELSTVTKSVSGLITEKPEVSEGMTLDDADNMQIGVTGTDKQSVENEVVKKENSSSAVSKIGSDEKVVSSTEILLSSVKEPAVVASTSTKVMDRESTAACLEAPVEASGLMTEKSVPCGETTSNPVKKANNSKKSVKKQPVKKKKSEASIMAWFQKVSGLGTKKAQPKTTGIKESKGKKIDSSEAKESSRSGTEHSESSDEVNSYTSLADVYSAKNTSSEVEMLNSELSKVAKSVSGLITEKPECSEEANANTVDDKQVSKAKKPPTKKKSVPAKKGAPKKKASATKKPVADKKLVIDTGINSSGISSSQSNPQFYDTSFLDKFLFRK